MDISMTILAITFLPRNMMFARKKNSNQWKKEIFETTLIWEKKLLLQVL